MRRRYEEPELTFIGPATDVVAGSGIGGGDSPHLSAPDFEFEPDWPLI